MRGGPRAQQLTQQPRVVSRLLTCTVAAAAACTTTAAAAAATAAAAAYAAAVERQRRARRACGVRVRDSERQDGARRQRGRRAEAAQRTPRRDRGGLRRGGGLQAAYEEGMALGAAQLEAQQRRRRQPRAARAAARAAAADVLQCGARLLVRRRVHKEPHGVRRGAARQQLHRRDGGRRLPSRPVERGLELTAAPQQPAHRIGRHVEHCGECGVQRRCLAAHLERSQIRGVVHRDRAVGGAQRGTVAAVASAPRQPHAPHGHHTEALRVPRLGLEPTPRRRPLAQGARPPQVTPRAAAHLVDEVCRHRTARVPAPNGRAVRPAAQ